jgi:hypothetical protein
LPTPAPPPEALPAWTRSSPGSGPRAGSPVTAPNTRRNGRWPDGSRSVGAKQPTAAFTRPAGTASRRSPGGPGTPGRRRTKPGGMTSRPAGGLPRRRQRLAPPPRLRLRAGTHPRSVDPHPAVQTPPRRTGPRQDQAPGSGRSRLAGRKDPGPPIPAINAGPAPCRQTHP